MLRLEKGYSTVLTEHLLTTSSGFILSKPIPYELKGLHQELYIGLLMTYEYVDKYRPEEASRLFVNSFRRASDFTEPLHIFPVNASLR